MIEKRFALPKETCDKLDALKRWFGVNREGDAINKCIIYTYGKTKDVRKEYDKRIGANL